jgi:hypothetical protein
MSKCSENNNTLYRTSIDSFRYSIPIESVDIINPNLYSHLIKCVVNKDSGEVLEETPIQENSLKVNSNGYQTHYIISNYFGKKHLIILINSKLLEHDYLEGITFKNIEKIYNQIQSHQIVNFNSFEQFLTIGFVTDCDIKKDIEIESHQEMDVLVNELYKLAKPTKKKNQGANAFTKRNNKGIEFNERTKSSFNHPFLKIYHKGIEALHSKNHLFFSKYIDIDSISKRVRIEATIKAKEDFKKHGIEKNDLHNILKTSEEQFTSIINDCINKNLDNPTNIKVRKPKAEMTPSDIKDFTLITMLLDNQSLTFERVLDIILSNMSDKVAKSRMKQRLTTLYNVHIKGLKIETKAQKLEKFFKALDLM